MSALWSNPPHLELIWLAFLAAGALVAALVAAGSFRRPPRLARRAAAVPVPLLRRVVPRPQEAGHRRRARRLLPGRVVRTRVPVDPGRRAHRGCARVLLGDPQCARARCHPLTPTFPAWRNWRICVLLSQYEAMSFSRLKHVLEKDGSLGTYLRKLEDAGYLAINKTFRDRPR